MGHPLYSKIKVCKKWFTNYIYKMWKIGGQKLPTLEKYLVRLKYHTRIWRKQLKNMISKALTLQRLVVNIIIKWFEIKFKAFGMIITTQSKKNWKEKRETIQKEKKTSNYTNLILNKTKMHHFHPQSTTDKWKMFRVWRRI